MRIWSAILVMVSVLWSLVWAPTFAVAVDAVEPSVTSEDVEISTHPADYSVGFVSQDAHVLSLRRGESREFILTVKNTGTVTWAKDVVRLGTDRPQDRVTGFVREDIVGGLSSGWTYENRIEWAGVNGDPTKMTALPNDLVTFSFWMSAPYEMALGTYREYFRVVADFITWMDDLGIFWEIAVTDGPYFTIVSQNAYPPALKAGESYKFVLTIENTGPTAWTSYGLHPTRLGTDRSRDRVPGFVREDKVSGSPSGWVGPNRVAMNEVTVLPNSTATFEFWYTVPSTMESGTYREYFRPVVEGVGWLDDYGIFWDVIVDNIPPQPSSIEATVGVGTVTVSWSAVSSAEYYTVRYREQGGTAFTYEDTTGTSTALTGLKGGVPYEIGVASRKGLKESSYQETVATPKVEVAVPSISGGVTTETPLEPEVTVIGPPIEDKEAQSQLLRTLSILLLIAAAVAAGYYAYDWWLERRKAVWEKPERPSRREPPKPPRSSSRW